MKHGVLGFFGDARHLDETIMSIATRHGLSRIKAASRLQLFVGQNLRVDHTNNVITIGDCYLQPVCAAEPGSGAWGSYLNFASKLPGHLEINRAALTGLPLYWTRLDGGILFFSHLLLAIEAGLPITTDFDYVRHLLAFSNLRTEHTGIIGISELLTGSSLIYDGEGPRVRCDWYPWSFTAPWRSDEPMAAEIERMAIDCVSAWSKDRSAIMLELSGGLDSSVVAASLAAAGISFSAANVATPSPDGDERRYARAVAAHLGVPLAETIHDVEGDDLAAPPPFASARPSSHAILAGIDAALGRTATALDAASLFSGIGGDNVFALTRSVAPVLDAFAKFGLGRRTGQALVDLAHLGNVTLWRALRLSWRQWRKSPEGTWQRDDDFAIRDALPDVPLPHPWDEGASGALFGKRLHVDAIRRILDFVDRPARWYDQDVIAPLLSQPLVELCLAVPSWEWIGGGHDRAVARAAFASRLPAAVVWRRNKGRLETMCASAFLAHRDQIATLLLEGRLAREGLLDRDRIAAYLGRGSIEGDFGYFRLLEIADVERWIATLPGAR